MKLVDKLLQANEEALVWSDVQRENRLRSIAFNATQQARIPFGRGDNPFTDADAQTSQDIYMILLRLERKAEVNAEQQHQHSSVRSSRLQRSDGSREISLPMAAVRSPQ